MTISLKINRFFSGTRSTFASDANYCDNPASPVLLQICIRGNDMPLSGWYRDYDYERLRES